MSVKQSLKLDEDAEIGFDRQVRELDRPGEPMVIQLVNGPVDIMVTVWRVVLLLKSECIEQSMRSIVLGEDNKNKLKDLDSKEDLAMKLSVLKFYKQSLWDD